MMMKAGFSVLFFTALPVMALDYETDIMPIFVKKCSECHSDKEGKTKGGLRVDNVQHLKNRYEKNGLIVPGDWDASYLFVTLFRPADHEDAMPPTGKGERLTKAETRLVQQWIAEGATIDGTTGEKGLMPKEGEPGYIAVEDDGGEKPVAAAMGEQAWTNTEGKTIRATLVRVEGDVALLRVKGGTVYRVPIGNLSEKSRAQLKR
ncbi:MAG: hypothetical protein HKN23_19320 [Verrucomicrobiales bacterium]|nr:hypothetical protein [Verrucomicrobiales bacterium]